MVVQDHKLIAQARTLMHLYEELLRRGMRNKEISNALGMYPSAFSNFINKVLKKLIETDITESDPATRVKEIFDQVNNISELKTRQRMARYINKLELLKTNPHQQTEPKGNATTRRSGPEKMLEGIYACYYLSTFGYRIKKEPLWIKRNKAGEGFTIKKGNRLGPSHYEGLGFIANNHIFSLQLQEQNTLVKDYFVAHFQLPPFYASSMDLLKGLSISMSNSFLPIARKVILFKEDAEPDEDLFEQMETLFFEESEEVKDQIVAYLQKGNSYLEYVPILHPRYDKNDLDREI